MARYITTTSSHFEPLSYDELVKPLTQMAEAQNAAQDAYDTLDLETSALQKYISETNTDDAVARALYKDYTDKLASLQDNLWKNGFNAQTRKDLAAAKAGFASNIGRLQAAVQARQARSKEYWEARHKDPSLVTGKDPGTAGLDNYLSNDNYGNDWYSYSGTAFAAEVGADAKARASEMLRNPQYIGSGLEGYIRKIEQTGFTNQEVNKAGNAVLAAMSGDSSALSKLDVPSSILASVLMSHLDSTGAAGKLDQDEFRRLFQYGMEGLSQAVGQTRTDELVNKRWELERKKELSGIKSGSGNGTASVAGTGWKQSGSYLRLISSKMQEASSELNKQFHSRYTDSSGNTSFKNITSANGDVIPVNNSLDAGKVIYDTDFRNEAKTLFGNIDIAVKHKDGDISPDGNFQITTDITPEERRRLNLPDDAVGLKVHTENGWEYDASATEVYNELKAAHDSQVNETLSNNRRNIKNDDVFSPEEAKKFRKSHGLPETVPDYDLEDAVKRTEARDDLVLGPTLLPATKDFDDIREDYMRKIMEWYGQFASAGMVGKSSPAAFYPVQTGGLSYGRDGEVDINKVMIPGDISSIQKIYILPEDIANGPDGRNYPKVRILADHLEDNGKQKGKRISATWIVDAHALGEEVYSLLADPVFATAVTHLSRPILDPVGVLADTDDQSQAWSQYVTGAYLDGEDPNFPTAKDIIRNDYTWSAYQDMINQYIESKLPIVIDESTYQRRQHPGLQSEKAEPYYRY